MYKHFEDDIAKMNAMYKIGSIDRTQPAMLERLVQLRRILKDEVAEIDDLIAMANEPNMTSDDTLRLVVGVADLMGDLQVYCASENLRWNIPNGGVLAIIMRSNFSKLGADGQPIIVDGKFQKGPNYWKPEPKIAEMLKVGTAAETIERVQLDMDAVLATAIKATEAAGQSSQQ